MRSRTALFPLFLLVATFTTAQTQAQTPFPAQIGNSVVALTGPWKFHPGDDMAWAQPGYDDSSWAPMDLTPPEGSTDPNLGASGFVPGWTTKGYPKLLGFAWYRLRVKVDNNAATTAQSALALKMPENVDDAYQVYADGQLIGEFGRFAPGHVTYYNSQPRAFPLPAGAGNRVITLAIRMWMDASTPFMSQDAGGLHGTPLLGQAPAIDAMLRLDWAVIGQFQASNILRLPLMIVVTLLAFTLFWLDRAEPAYFWLGWACLAHAFNSVASLIGYYTTWMSMIGENLLIDVVFGTLPFAFWMIFWGYWFRLEEIRLVRRITWGLVAVLIVATTMLRAPLYGGIVPVAASSWLFPLTIVVKLLLGLLFLWVTFRGIRRQGAEGWLVLPAVLLMFFWLYSDELTMLRVPLTFHFLGMVLNVGQIAIVLMLAVMSVLLLRRFISGQREKERLESEMEQARSVQQVLIPEALPSVKGFAIESDYRPARQVGGDFFQIVALGDGGVLAAIGDVSGKGMPAAMTVSLLVGTLRAEARHTDSPAQLLTAMNTRMIGRSKDGFTTCLIVRVDADGKVTAANAGHMPPYLNGQETPVANSLPLGLSMGAKYGESSLQLEMGDRLTLLTDGVVEARNAAGDLFGFERAAQMSRESAAAIAEAAQRFGQQDDITVLTLHRVAKDETPPQKARMALSPA
jgi:hypothetical protein